MSPAASTARAAALAAARRYAEHLTTRNRIDAETRAQLAGSRMVDLMTEAAPPDREADD